MSEEGVGGPYPPLPFSGKVKLKNLLNLIIRIVKLLLKWQTKEIISRTPLLGKWEKFLDPRVNGYYLVSRR